MQPSLFINGLFLFILFIHPECVYTWRICIFSFRIVPGLPFYLLPDLFNTTNTPVLNLELSLHDNSLFPPRHLATNILTACSLSTWNIYERSELFIPQGPTGSRSITARSTIQHRCWHKPQGNRLGILALLHNWSCFPEVALAPATVLGNALRRFLREMVWSHFQMECPFQWSHWGCNTQGGAPLG